MENMATILDVAAYILDKKQRLTTMKLQKLTYYAQAKRLADTGMPLFSSDFHAWLNGPVCTDLFRQHRGRFFISAGQLPGDGTVLNAGERHAVDWALERYGNLNGNQLSDLTHQEDPWLKARGDLAPDEHSDAVITKKSMLEYYRKNL